MEFGKKCWIRGDGEIGLEGLAEMIGLVKRLKEDEIRIPVALK